MIANTGAFLGKTVFVTGGSRGIGRAIALKLARDGANVAIAAKTVEKHPKLEGTIYSVAEEIEKAGGKALPIQCNVLSEEDVTKAIEATATKFGGLDILINNASAISITGTEDLPMKKYDLMNNLNARGTFMTSKYAVPHLKKSSNGHILTMSPPLLLDPKWLKDNTGYAIAKYGMSMCVLGMAEEFKGEIAVNALWPRTMIYTSAMNLLGGIETLGKHARTPDILADAAYLILQRDKATEKAGNFFIDEPFLREHGVTDFEEYAVKKGEQLAADIFIPDELMEGLIGL